MVKTRLHQLFSLQAAWWCTCLAASSFAQSPILYDRVVTYNSTSWFVDFADLNGDQIKDMVGIYGNSSTDIKIFNGKPDETFELKTTLAGGTLEYYHVFLRHLNSDNVPDIIAVSWIAHAVYLSSPTGYVKASIPTPGFFTYTNPDATFTADFDNDGDQDLFINACLLINNNGAFTYNGWFMGNGGAVAPDFNNDGFLDLVMTNPGNGTISFYRGNGNGTFQPPLTKNATVHTLLDYDLNHDGFVDILGQGYNGEYLFFFNDAASSFSQTSTFSLGHNYYSVMKVFDFDHNGAADFVTSDDHTIQFRPILANGSFGAATTFEVGLPGSLRNLIVTDAIGDPSPDLVVMSGFGVIKIFTGKVNPAIQFVQTAKAYDGLPFSSFYQANPAISSTTVSYAGLGAPPKDVGSYTVTIESADPTHEAQLTGTVSINKSTLTVGVADVSIAAGQPIPVFPLVYSGFASAENSSALSQVPVASTTATPFSGPGDYPITISGGVDENYAFNYQEGVLRILSVTGIDETRAISIFPNPAVEKIRINSTEWTIAKLYDVNGRTVVTREYADEEISLTGCVPGIYVLQVQLKNGNTVRKKLIIK